MSWGELSCKFSGFPGGCPHGPTMVTCNTSCPHYVAKEVPNPDNVKRYKHYCVMCESLCNAAEDFRCTECGNGPVELLPEEAVLYTDHVRDIKALGKRLRNRRRNSSANRKTIREMKARLTEQAEMIAKLQERRDLLEGLLLEVSEWMHGTEMMGGIRNRIDAALIKGEK